MENQIYYILNDMSDSLNIAQMKRLQEVLIKRLEVTEYESETIDNNEYLEMFLAAKHIEGCSDKTIAYYKTTIVHMLESITLPLRQIN